MNNNINSRIATYRTALFCVTSHDDNSHVLGATSRC